MGSPPSLPAGVDLDDVPVPRRLWSRSGRPFRGEGARFGLASTLVLMGLLSGTIPGLLLLTAAGVASFFLVPVLVDRRLERLGARLMTTPADRIGATLKGLDDRWIVYVFAPHAWAAALRGRLHLRAGDGRAAAAAYAECGRMCGDPEAPEVVRGQARGLVMSGDRKQVRELFKQLQSGPGLDARDRLAQALVLLQESGRHKQARASLEEAREALGDQPRWQAAMALALARTGAAAEAVPLYEALREREGELDPTTRDLLKRARKSLRGELEDRGRDRADDGAGDGDDTADQGGGAQGRGKRDGKEKKKKKKKKKDRRKDRRERRKKNKEKRERRKEKPQPETTAAPKPTPPKPAVAPKPAAPKPVVPKPVTPKPAAPKPAAAAKPAAARRPVAPNPPAPTSVAPPKPAAPASPPLPPFAPPRPPSPSAAPKPAVPRPAAPKPAAPRPVGPKPVPARPAAAARPTRPTPAAPKPAAPGAKPAAPGAKPATARPAPPRPAPTAAPAAAPVVPPPPLVAPPKVPPPPLGGGGSDDGWGDLLDAPTKPKK